MAQTYKATYKTFNGVDWDTYYFKTLASLIIPETNYKLVTDSEKTAISGIAGLSGAGFIKKTANGYAIDTTTYLTASSTLDATKLTGKVPIACIPDSVLGQLEYKGVFSAYTQSSISGLEKGWYYICSTAGQYNPDGTTSSTGYNVGDWAVYNGSSWDKVDNTDSISSWCGLTGAITVAQARNALVGAIAPNNEGFVTGDAVNELRNDLTIQPEITQPELISPTVRAPDHQDTTARLVFAASNGISSYWNDAQIYSDYDDRTQHQSLTLDTPGDIILETSGSGHVKINDGGWEAILNASNISQSRQYTFPDANGTLALLSDIHNSNINIQKNGVTVDNFTLNQSSGKNINIAMTKSDVGLGNVENKSVAMIRSELTGSVQQNNTNFPTGGAVYTAVTGKLDGFSEITKRDAGLIPYDTHSYGYFWENEDSSSFGWRFYRELEDEDTGDLYTYDGFIGLAPNVVQGFVLASTDGIAITTTYQSFDDRSSFMGVRLKTTNLNTEQEIEFPNDSGTFALTKDLPTYYVQSTQPSGSNVKAGDFWFDTSN